LRRARTSFVLGLGVGLPLAALAAGAARSRPRPGHPYLAGAPLLIAHRGGAELAPENTLPAFRDAVDRWSADVLELDVHPSKDGEAVVIHDDTVDRTTDGTGSVVEQTLDRLRCLDAGYRFTLDGSTFPYRGDGLQLPTLEEVLRAFPGVRVIVEIKDGRVQERVWETVREEKAWHRVLVASAKRRDRSRLSHYPGPISASATELRTFLFLHRLHSTGLYRPRVDALQVPERSAGRQVLDPRFVREAHALNLPVHVWTVNAVEDMRRLLSWGVDGIVTDRPDLLAGVLHETVGRPLPPGSSRNDASWQPAEEIPGW
jgi:glycerophosphoryl diester phosphodiesterase